ncbi:MAG: hypothetical protein MI799_13175 [Desulfobacterales bacterium]|nr:hypothetical protein [Desulfobacterales bacterium]
MKYSWWIFQILMLGLSVFFMIFGFDLLRASYTFKDPFSFIMTFFAASFILLISATLGISFVIKMVRVYKRSKQEPTP